MKKIAISLYLLISCFVSLYASESLNEAKEYFKSGEYDKALPLFMENYDKSPRNASINQWVGVCLYETGKFEDAKKYLRYANKRGILKAPYYLGLVEYKMGNYQLAEDYISTFEDKADEIPDECLHGVSAVKSAVSMLEHVEKIVIIDSLVVDKEDFFKHYRISPEIGTFNDCDLIENSNLLSINPIYMPESGEKRIWSAKDNDSTSYSIYQSTKLVDNSWDMPILLDKMFTGDSDYIFPFLKPDGTSIYFASNCDNSIGGYDIFVAGKDIESNEFLMPQNIGLPYNSPFDDYLLVYDEINGFGWWATDRNQLGDKITIYVFIPNEIRTNYSEEDENIESLAFIKSIRDTWESENGYDDLKTKIDNIDMTPKNKKCDFEFIISNKIKYYSMSDFKTAEGVSLMESVLEMQKQLNSKMDELAALRSEYQKNVSARNAENSNKILELEKSVKDLRYSILKTSNDIRRLENNNI